MPVPPVNSFASDNAAGVSPEVMQAIADANRGSALAYGDDAVTRRALDAFDDLFGQHVETFFCWGGTGANVVGLATLIQPWQAVICPDTAHIVVDECGAPARFTGATIAPVPTVDGKLTIEAIEPFLQWSGSEHHPQPGVLSITQSTESGTLYTTDEIGVLCDFARRHSLLVHLDGARIANAVAATGDDLRTMVRDTGVDVMTFGMTKNGGMYGEAVIFVRPELARSAAYVRKQAGQLASKSRYIAAQANSLLQDDRWIANARRANEMAALLAARVGGIDGVELQRAPEVNSVFVRVPADAITLLQQWSFFWEWDLGQSLVRWMTSFATTPEDIERFASGVEAILGARATKS